MYTVAQLAGRSVRNCVLATIQSRANLSVVSLHKLSLLKVGRQDSSGNVQVLLASALFWTGFYEIKPGLNPTIYQLDMFEIIKIGDNLQFMALKQAVVRSDVRITFSYYEATRFLVLTTKAGLRENLPNLLLQLEAPEESIAPVIEAALQRIAV